MVWYVALVAILNLGLGYALAVFLGARQKQPAITRDEIDAPLDFPARVDKLVEERLLDESTDGSLFETENLASTIDTPRAADIDPTTGLTTREHIEQRLADFTLTHADIQPMAVALFEIEPAKHGAEGVDDRLLRGVTETVRELLADLHTAGRYSDQQILLLLPHDDLQHATQRAEQVRQRVEATQYMADGQNIQATVTCALTQIAASHTVDNLLEFLEETLEEAKRYGGNRTFMHDGTSPTPVVPPELNIAPQICAI